MVAPHFDLGYGQNCVLAQLKLSTSTAGSAHQQGPIPPRGNGLGGMGTLASRGFRQQRSSCPDCAQEGSVPTRLRDLTLGNDTYVHLG